MKKISFIIIALSLFAVSSNANTINESKYALDINKIKNSAYSKKLEDKRALMSQERENKAVIRNYKEFIASL